MGGYLQEGPALTHSDAGNIMSYYANAYYSMTDIYRDTITWQSYAARTADSRTNDRRSVNEDLRHSASQGFTL